MLWYANMEPPPPPAIIYISSSVYVGEGDGSFVITNVPPPPPEPQPLLWLAFADVPLLPIKKYNLVPASNSNSSLTTAP